MQAQSLVAGPQVPTLMEFREQTLLVPLWWAQLETVQWILLFAFMLLFMGQFLLLRICRQYGSLRGPLYIIDTTCHFYHRMEGGR